MKLSAAKAKVLRAFLEDASQEQYGFGLMRATGVKSGSLYPILESLEREGWVESYQEEIDQYAEGRPRRRMYRLTEQGERESRKAVAQFYLELGPQPSWLPGFQGS